MSHSPAGRPQRRSVVGAIAVLALGVVLAGCEGAFERPAFDSPRDPANGQLPPTPPNLRAEPVGCGGQGPLVTLTWGGDNAPGGFQLYRAARPDEDPGELVWTGRVRTCTDGGVTGLPALSSNTRYWYRVRSLDADGVPSLRSDSVSVLTETCP